MAMSGWLAVNLLLCSITLTWVLVYANDPLESKILHSFVIEGLFDSCMFYMNPLSLVFVIVIETFDECMCCSSLYFSFCFSFTYSHRNFCGRNKKLNISLERGQIDSIFRINYTDPWIQLNKKTVTLCP